MTDLTTPERHVVAERIFNLRDLGGYPTADGATTRWGRLYRGDGLHRLPPEVAERLGLATVIDLRSHVEVEERGRFTSDAVGWHHLPVLRRSWDASEWTDDVVADRFLADRYLDMLEEGGTAIAATLHLLADAVRLPAAFHCAAGKDRTGVVAALVLSLVGVDDDKVAADYGLTRLGMARMVEWWRAENPEVEDAMSDQPRAFMESPDEAMHLFLAGVRAAHRSVEGYAAAIGVGPDAVAALRSNLVGDPLGI